MIEENDKIIDGIFESWEVTKDMAEFLENLRILDSTLLRSKQINKDLPYKLKIEAIMKLIITKKEELGLSGTKVIFFL